MAVARHLSAVEDSTEDTEEAERVREALDALRPEFVACRDLGHVWDNHSARWFPKERVYVQTLKCPRCDTERVRELSEYGHPVSQQYDYQPGYQMPKGTGYLTSGDRDTLRLRSVQALVSGTKPKPKARPRHA